MILFPNAKINIGLRILRRRPDRYHDLHTVMVPVPWCDILEMVPAAGNGSFSMPGGDTLGIPPEDNLVLKALCALERHIGQHLPPLDIYLKKNIPNGAGLGGGSSDASFAIMGANEIFKLGLGKAELAEVAAGVGADCPFFIYNRPMLAEGIGERLSEIDIPVLDGMDIVIAKPRTSAVSTAAAYAGVTPCELPAGANLATALSLPVSQWQGDSTVSNDFEQSIFALRPEISAVKERMLESGATYAAMSGSGAAVFGLFGSDKLAEAAARQLDDCEIFVGKLSSGRLG